MPTNDYGHYDTVYTAEQAEADRKARSARIDAAIAERQREEADDAARHERERREAGTARLAAYRADCETRWLDNGGEAAAFARGWPDLRDKWLSDQLSQPERELQRHSEALKAT